MTKILNLADGGSCTRWLRAAGLVGCFTLAGLAGCGGGDPKLVRVYTRLALYAEAEHHATLKEFLPQHGIVPRAQDRCGVVAGDEFLKQFLLFIDAYAPRLAFFEILESDVELALALGFRVATPAFMEWNPTDLPCAELLHYG